MGSSAMKKKKVFLKALSVLLAVITAGAALYSNGAAAESKEGQRSLRKTPITDIC